MKIFISHASKDVNLVRQFVELLYHIGIHESNIFCSSVPELSIPEGENICDYLASMFQKEKLYVIFMLSNDYYNSVMCLNEMGAAWVTKTDYTTILFPSFEYKEIKGAIDPRKISIKLDNEFAIRQLNQLKTKLQKVFNIAEDSISQERWERYRNNFIQQASGSYQNILGSISLKHSRSFCIGDQVADGCVIDSTTLSNSVLSATIDFSKTLQDLCSVVIFPQKSNWEFAVKKHYCLCFEAISSHQLPITLEIKREGTPYHARKKLNLNDSLNSYVIKLDEYGDFNKWKNVTEICFLIERKDCSNPSIITIRNLRLK